MRQATIAPVSTPVHVSVGMHANKPLPSGTPESNGVMWPIDNPELLPRPTIWYFSIAPMSTFVQPAEVPHAQEALE